MKLEQSNGNITTAPLFYMPTIEGIALKNQKTTIEHTFRWSSNLFSVIMHFNKSHIGDKISAFMNKDTIVGTTTSNETSATIIPVSTTVIAKARKGYEVEINGIFSLILDIGEKDITVSEPTTTTSGDLVKISYYMLKDHMITSITFGRVHYW